MTIRGVLARCFWFFTLPLFLVNLMLWTAGQLLERFGEVVMATSESLHDLVKMWGRTLLSVEKKGM